MPERISGHRVLSLLGRGAMGEVYKALNNHGRERVVAVKVLNDRLADNRYARRRFRREIETTAKIDHPNVVDILDWGEFEGRLWFSMEYLPGRHLGHWIRGFGELTLDTKLAIAVQLSNALEEAHRHGVIHRDIKPANVMVHAGHESLSVKLLDFGIVHVERSEITTPNSQPGTYSYMSPEQLRADPMDHRSDLFSLGIVLYELFTGRHPFHEQTDPLITTRILHDEPDSIESQTLDAGISSLLFRMLEKRAEDRPSSAATIGRTFDGLRLALATVIPEDDPGYQGLDRVTRSKVEHLEALARMRSGEGDLAGAIEAYRTVRKLAPDSSRIVSRLEKLEHRRLAAEKLDRYLKEARQALDEGRLRIARERCEQAWVLDPQSEHVDTLRKWIALRSKDDHKSEQRKLERALKEVQALMDEGRFDEADYRLNELAQKFPTQTLVRFLQDRVHFLLENKKINYQDYRRALKEAEAELEADYLESALQAVERAREQWPEDDEWEAMEARILERRQREGDHLFNRCQGELRELDAMLETALDEEIGARLDTVQTEIDRLERLGHDTSLIESLRQEYQLISEELERRRLRRLDRQSLVESAATKKLEVGRLSMEQAQQLEDQDEIVWPRAFELYREAKLAFTEVCRVRSGHAEAEQSLSVVERAMDRLQKRMDETRRKEDEIKKLLEECQSQVEESRRLSIEGSTVPVIAKRLLRDANLSLKRVLELDPNCLKALELQDQIESLEASLARRADRKARLANAIHEGLCVGRSELAVAKRLVMPEDAQTLEKGLQAAYDAQTAYRRVLAVDPKQQEALTLIHEVDSLIDHYKSELLRLKADQSRTPYVEALVESNQEKIESWIKMASKTLADAKKYMEGDAIAQRTSRAYCAEVDVVLQHVLFIEPDHDEANRLNQEREELLVQLSIALDQQQAIDGKIADGDHKQLKENDVQEVEASVALQIQSPGDPERPARSVWTRHTPSLTLLMILVIWFIWNMLYR